jgi:RNA polymerase sigma-70 factor (ECF subfamily)
MAKIEIRQNNDALVRRAHTDADALGALYEVYYDRIYRFLVYRLFDKQAAQDVTGDVFLAVARGMRGFQGAGEADFRSWLYAIASKQANAWIRKTVRRRRLLGQAAVRLTRPDSAEPDDSALDWPTLHRAILELKPKNQTILTLRFFENMDFEQIGKIVGARPSSVRVTIHRILNRLRRTLQVIDG